MASITPTAFAHDFWLAPGQYISETPTSVSIQFKVGHKENINNWNLRWDTIVALRSYNSDGVTDLAASIIPKSDLLPGAAKTPTLQPGTYVIGFESYHSVSELVADKFNSYVKDEGLKAIAEYRQSNGLMNSTGIELYSRKAKTIVQIGDELTANATKPVGHTLEIVPLQHPYDLANDGSLSVKVLFRGQPLQHAKIDALPLNNATHTAQSARTDNKGHATFKFNKKGPVKLNVVWGVPLQNNNRADFETYFSSLTFTANHAAE
ncbi:DUF4198 domain-containing protein [Salinimonas chungwhensis]|uniref:DUF4198 domain-containing protein n=1 Tax=Salinimonas chungwhensis TaxID=265425 RepID=UPI00039BF187|nr:DUF4198 domain-containing protein [Salinimonas chungwhensis]